MTPKSQPKKNKPDLNESPENPSKPSKETKTTSWEVRIPKKVHSKIDKLEKNQREQVIDVIKDLARDPYFDSERVAKYGKQPVYRRRAGKYRIIYYVSKRIRIVDVMEVDHRKKVYN